jgi:hypothetical protein
MENNSTFSKNNTPGELINNRKTTHLNRIINSSNNARRENVNSRLNLQVDNQFVLMPTMNKEKSNLSDLYSPIHTQAIIENDSTTNNDKNNENNLADIVMSSPINEMEIVPELKKSDSENAEFKGIYNFF